MPLGFVVAIVMRGVKVRDIQGVHAKVQHLPVVTRIILNHAIVIIV
ncbi:MAG: hypothetical protein HYT72_03580 [Candidatus Aenigmarchaeota archaeon]|nr:hypothetical protein [Candidatus Aenigmarchaeota archaeon]